MKQLITTLILATAMYAGLAWSEDQNTAEQFRTLDNKVQDLKRMALDVGREIAIMEEELLFPTSTQYGLYLATDIDESYKLVSVIVKLDGVVVNNYMYDVSELSALQNGAVHQLHKGNLKTGKHSLNITYMGRVGKQMTRHTQTHEFDKGDKPVFIELTIRGKQLDQGATPKEPAFSVRQWS